MSNYGQKNRLVFRWKFPVFHQYVKNDNETRIQLSSHRKQNSVLILIASIVYRQNNTNNNNVDDTHTYTIWRRKKHICNCNKSKQKTKTQKKKMKTFRANGKTKHTRLQTKNRHRHSWKSVWRWENTHTSEWTESDREKKWSEKKMRNGFVAREDSH